MTQLPETGLEPSQRSVTERSGIAIAPNGNVLVSDYSHDAVDVYDSVNGAFIRTAVDAGYLLDSGMAVASHGNILLDESGSISVVSNPGTLIRSFGTTTVTFNLPAAGSGDVYHGDSGYTNNPALYGIWKCAGCAHGAGTTSSLFCPVLHCPRTSRVRIRRQHLLRHRHHASDFPHHGWRASSATGARRLNRVHVPGRNQQGVPGRQCADAETRYLSSAGSRASVSRLPATTARGEACPSPSRNGIWYKGLT